MAVLAIPAVAAAIAAGSAAATVGSTIVGAVGSANAGAATQEQARRNAALAQVAAADAERRGEVQAGQARMQASRVVGAQRAAYSASGVDVGSGSPAAVAASSQAFGEMDAATARANAAREAWGYRTQSADMVNQGNMAKAAGDAQAFGTILGGAGRLASQSADIYLKGKAAKWWDVEKPKTGGGS